MSMEKIFEKTLDNMGNEYPKSPSIVVGVARMSDSTFPVVAGARKLDLLGEDPIELAEMILSIARSLKKVCQSVAGEESGGAMFDLVCSKAMEMSDEEDAETTIEEREWEHDETGETGKIQIDDLTKDWKGFIE